MSQPVLHVLMPAYNVQPHILKSLTSLQAQTYPNVKFLIIDDGSTDETRQIVSQLAANDNRFNFVPSDENRGISKRREELVAMSNDIDPTAHFMWLDGDDQITDPEFTAKLMGRMTSVNADVCLFNFGIEFENDTPELLANAQGLLNDAKLSGQILDDICATEEQVVSVLSMPNVARFTSLGWTKAYAPQVKANWPKAVPGMIFEDFVYMAGIFNADRVTAFPSDYKPVTYLRRAQSATGDRKPQHFTQDVPAQMLALKEAVTAPEKQEAIGEFVRTKMGQYQMTLDALVAAGKPGFDEALVQEYAQCKQKLLPEA